ncbi:MAG: GDP-mannose 4,6-dehydratase [Candidatus Micrarchaeia archaeon]
MAKILVTGGAGFIGSHIADALVEKNEVVVLDNLSTGNIENIRHNFGKKRFRFVKGDVTNECLVGRLAKDCDIIIHQAAVVGVKHYVANPLSVLLVNAHGTESVLEAGRKNDCEVLFASTSEVYGKCKDIPLSEDDDRLLGSTKIDRWCYSTSKAFDEHLCFAYVKEYGVDVKIVRYFNTYGPRARSNDYSGVIPIFIRRVLHGKPPQVHGDGKQTRCFTYISDVVEGTLLVCRRGRKGEVYNIGNNEETSIIELANAIVRISGRKLKPEFIDYEDFYGESYEDIRRRVPDISKMKKLGWKPKVGLLEGLKKTFDWYKEEMRR